MLVADQLVGVAVVSLNVTVLLPFVARFGRLCLLKMPFLLRPLMLRSDRDYASRR